MAIVVRFNPPSLSASQYDSTISALEAQEGNWPPDGLDYHVCFGEEGSLLVSEIWDSQEQFEAFGERLMPVLEQAGIEPGEPTVFQVHNTIKR
jgi:hypothetical protein